MRVITYEDLIKNGVHYGHLVSKWNPAMRPYIFGQKQGVHIIDVAKTKVMLEKAAEYAKGLAKAGKTIMFVGTKKQAKDILRKYAEETEMPYVVERWLGGFLTNFDTVKASIRKLQEIERLLEEVGDCDSLKEQKEKKIKKKECLMLRRKQEKMNRVLSGVKNMFRMPDALFIVDITEEAIAINETHRLDIPVIAIVDTNADPNIVDYPIPGNDDAIQSIDYITSVIAEAIKAGKKEREEEEELEIQKAEDLAK